MLPKRKDILGARCLRITIPHTIQPQEHSRGGGIDDRVHVSFKGKSQVVYAWFDKSKRKGNLNWFDNRWNSNYWFAALWRNSSFFFRSLPSGSLFKNLFHPPAEHLADLFEHP
jgi:hypothetical protein